MASAESIQALGSRIAQWRKAWAWSQRELARQAGITNGALSQIEKGNTSPSVHTLEKIAGALGVTLEQLMFGEVTPPFHVFEPDETEKALLPSGVSGFSYASFQTRRPDANIRIGYFELIANARIAMTEIPFMAPPRVCLIVCEGQVAVQGGGCKQVLDEGAYVVLEALPTVFLAALNNRSASLLLLNSDFCPHSPAGTP